MEFDRHAVIPFVMDGQHVLNRFVLQAFKKYCIHVLYNDALEKNILQVFPIHHEYDRIKGLLLDAFSP